MPTSSDLVTDLPADFEVFGQAVDTALVDLKGGTTNQILAKNSNTDMDFKWVSDATGMTNPMTTTGDTIYSSSGSTPARLGIGSTGDVLTVAGGVPSWAAPAGYNPNYSLLNSGGTALSGVTTRTISGISAKNDLFIIVAGASADAGAEVLIRLNTDTGANYFQRVGVAYAASTASQDDITVDNGNTTSLLLGRMSINAGSIVNASAQITGTNSAGLKMVSSVGTSNASGANYAAMIASGGYWSGSATVTSVSIVSSSANFDAGTVYVYAS